MTASLRIESLPVGESFEESPGLIVERRSFLGLAAAALGASTFAGAAGAGALARATTRRGGELSFEQFLEEVVPLAEELLAEGRYVEDRYLHAIASHAVRIAGVEPPAMRPQEGNPGAFIGISYGSSPFTILHWRLAPGGVIRPHAHTYGNVVTLGLEGEVRVRNYQRVEPGLDFDTQEPFAVRETTDQILTAGRVNLVPLEHDYCHGFTAGPEGARGLDITTRTKPKRESVPYLELSEEPVDAARRIYTGRWSE